MPSRGDISASEVYADREMLNRLGYGIFDVTFGKDGGVGFENVRDFSYVVAQDDDPRLYRRKVYELIGRYYPNRLAKELWDKFINHKWVMSERAGYEIDLITAANDWFNRHGHQFLKEWTFRQSVVPTRIRNQSEPSTGMLGVVASRLFPNLRELLNAGFSITDVARAAVSEATVLGHWRAVPLTQQPRRRLKIVPRFPIRRPARKKGPQRDGNNSDEKWQDDTQYLVVKKLTPADIAEGRYYVRLVANLTGHEPRSPEEAERRWSEILEHKWYLSERAGHDVGLATAALDYFRRLTLIEEAETGQEV